MGKECYAVQKMLPWFVNGSLECEEKKLVLGHVAECAECRNELAFVAEMQKAARSLSCAPDELQQRHMLNNMISQIAGEDEQAQAGSNYSDRLLRNILKNPSPYGIIAAIVNEMKSLLNENFYEAKQQLQLGIDSLKIYSLILQKVVR